MLKNRGAILATNPVTSISTADKLKSMLKTVTDAALFIEQIIGQIGGQVGTASGPGGFDPAVAERVTDAFANPDFSQTLRLSIARGESDLAMVLRKGGRSEKQVQGSGVQFLSALGSAQKGWVNKNLPLAFRAREFFLFSADFRWARIHLAGAGRCGETGLGRDSCWPAAGECGVR